MPPVRLRKLCLSNKLAENLNSQTNQNLLRTREFKEKNKLQVRYKAWYE